MQCKCNDRQQNNQGQLSSQNLPRLMGIEKTFDGLLKKFELWMFSYLLGTL